MMKGQIEEQNNSKELAREAYNQGVSRVVTVSLHLSISAQDALSISLLIHVCSCQPLITYWAMNFLQKLFYQIL